MLLHMTTELPRTTEGARTPVRTLGKSSDGNMVDLAVDWRDHGCARDLGRDVGLRSDGYVDRLWGNDVDIPLIHAIGTIDVVKESVVSQ